MSMIFFTFRSQTVARKGEMHLRLHRISERVGKTPGYLAVNGCGVGIWVQEQDGAAAAEVLRNNGCRYEKSYRISDNTHQEVQL